MASSADGSIDYAKDALERINGNPSFKGCAEMATKGLSMVANGIMAYEDFKEGIENGDLTQAYLGLSEGLDGSSSLLGLCSDIVPKLPEKIKNRLGDMSSVASCTGSTLEGFCGAAGMVVGIGDGDLHEIADGASLLLDGGKSISYSLSKFSDPTRLLGGAGGAISVFSGISDIYNGFDTRDSSQMWSGVFRSVGGTSAIIGCCCPVAAPIMFGISAGCGVIDFCINLFG